MEPSRANGIAIDSEVLAAVIEASQGYPYFIQEWGDAMLNAATGARITLDAFKSASRTFDGVRERFYMGRYRELEEAGLPPAAEAIAEEFAPPDNPVLSSAAVDRTLHRVGAGLPERQALNARGYIWFPQRPDAKELFG